MKQLTEELRNITVKEVLVYAVFIVACALAIVLVLAIGYGSGSLL